MLLSPSRHDISLRPYQEECLAAIPDCGAFLIQMATGLGKTVTFSRIPRRGRMLILAHRDELVHQPGKYFDVPVGVEMGPLSSHGEDVVCASVPSLVRRLHRFAPDDFDVIITDECHHAAAATYQKIIAHFKPRLHLGFTATPNRNDGVGLEHIYEDIIFERDLVWGIQNGWLSDIRCLRADIGFDLRAVALRMGDYAPGELERAVNVGSANRAVAEVVQRYAVPPVLIFCVSVDHAQSLAREIPGAASVVGGMERAETLGAFARGEIPVLTNCMVFTEGTDLPNVRSVVVARPTRNISLYAQMVGRGTRLAPGKECLTLIDCVGNDADLCSAPSLLGLDLKMVKQTKHIEGDLFDLPEIVRREWDRPECWVRNVEYVDLWARSKRYRTHGVNWFRMPDGSMVLAKPKIVLPPEDSLGRVEWRGQRVPMQRALDDVFRLLRTEHEDERYLWDLAAVKRWGAYQATDKQKAMVRRFLPRFDTGALTKLEAGQILTRCFYGG